MTDMTDVSMEGVKAAQDFPLLPDGEYQMFLAKSEKKPNSKGTGHFLALEFVIIGGPHDNAKIFHNLNLWNPNDIAVNIAKSEWLVLCQAIKGVPAVKNSEELHDKKFIGTVAIEERLDENKKSFEPKRYQNKLVCKEGKIRLANGAVPQASVAQASAVPVAQAAVAGSKKAPW